MPQTATALRIDATPAGYQPHFTHGAERVWTETNCYLDLWIEILNCLGLNPVPTFAALLSADHDGLSWTFVKPQPDELRRLYGLEVDEENTWLPFLEMVETGPLRGVLHTAEVDSWWLCDTAGTAYRTEHVKTTITPVRVDRERRQLRYLHNAGLFELSGPDFDGIFGLTSESSLSLPPYLEVIRHFPNRTQPDALTSIVREHLSRRPDGNPITRLAACIDHATAWLPDEGMPRFHLWAFASLRQCGATAELLADLAEYLDDEHPGAADSAAPLRNVATAAKSVQFKMARVVSGRKVNVAPSLSTMASDWQIGIDGIAQAVC
ncbi:DUF1839 family protein [Mycobacterium sp. CBMA293]|nr:DUF1839 family protein [Mycolicibacterium sp. CBMA 360]MUL56966.1 DUF1839 family protein [Mycolicibacterium sp. CBMA 335]MUL70006.1 DUF1839 family protein [Mycolicibacterium sp. CBMA 311]MUL92054.1 DUF1839 family protein [Mycolicibacterium sp. CBMA 230]MUM05793.1 hypothetical protein [Mycolicibacterium sp. CBMA 213]MUM10910.1 DUF1839 family protein [Mycolicibacterium sp. CBMA 293]